MIVQVKGLSVTEMRHQNPTCTVHIGAILALGFGTQPYCIWPYMGWSMGLISPSMGYFRWDQHKTHIAIPHKQNLQN